MIRRTAVLQGGVHIKIRIRFDKTISFLENRFPRSETGGGFKAWGFEKVV